MKIWRFLILGTVTVFGISFFQWVKKAPNEIGVNFFPVKLEPSIRVSIEENQFDCLLDLGSGPALILKAEALNRLGKKQEQGPVTFSDLKGNKYPSQAYRLGKVLIDQVKLYDLEALRDHPDFHIHSQFGPQSNDLKLIESAKNRVSRFDGKVGRDAFKSYDCFLDFPNSTVQLNPKGTGNKWCPPEEFTSVPIELNMLGISLLIETDFGIHRILLDTGATYSFVRKSLQDRVEVREVVEESGDWYFYTNKLLIGNSNFGPWEFGFFEIAEKWDIDGCLGVDFLLEHSVYLDFENKMAYVKKPEKFFLATQWKRAKHRFTQFSKKYLSN